MDDIDADFVDTYVAPLASSPPYPQLPPGCVTGRQIVGVLAQALERGHIGGGIFSADGNPLQRVRDAVNSPKTELDVEIPFWPWSTETSYCDDSPQKQKAGQLLFDLFGATGENAQADKRNEEVKQKLKDTFAGWWATLAGWLKVICVVVVVLALAWVVRSFRSVS